MPRQYSSEFEKALAKVQCDMNVQLYSKHREAIGTFGSDVFVSGLPTGFETSVASYCCHSYTTPHATKAIG